MTNDERKVVCPICGNREGLLEGPQGGLAMNLKCPSPDCGRVFWYAPGFGLRDPLTQEKFPIEEVDP